MQQELWAIFSLLRESITFSKICLFWSAIVEWNNPNLRNSKIVSVFKEKKIPKGFPPSSFIDYPNPKGIKLITRLWIGLSHLKEHKFKYSFQDTINALCDWGQHIESFTEFFLHCPFFINDRHTLISTIRSLQK